MVLGSPTGTVSGSPVEGVKVDDVVGGVGPDGGMLLGGIPLPRGDS